MSTGADRPAIDLLDGRLYAQGSHPTYAWMRAHEPVYFDDKNGVWGVASYDAVLAASKDTATFSSSGGIRPVARLELRVIFDRLLERLPDLELAAEDALPRRAANFISGLESMPVRFTPTAPTAPIP